MELDEIDNDLLNSIKSNDQFLSRVIKMIPKELYRPPVVDPIVANSKYHKHRRLPLEPDSRKLLSKQKKQSKYDPTYDDEVDDDDNDIESGVEEDDGNSEKSINLSNLKKRLQDKVAVIKKDKKDKGDNKMVKNGDKKINKITNHEIKAINDISTIRNELMQTNKAEVESVLDSTADSTDIETNTTEISYNLIDGEVKKKLPKDFGKPGSKTKRLQEKLDEIEKKRRRLQELREKGEEGKELLQQELWSNALKSASGERIINDPNVIKKQLKKIEKVKAKKANEWKARLKEVEKTKKVRQETREKNILKRKNKETTTKDIKENKPRPGFEGKKTEILNKKPENSTKPTTKT